MRRGSRHWATGRERPPVGTNCRQARERGRRRRVGKALPRGNAGDMSQLYDLTADTVRWLYDRRISAPPILDENLYFPQVFRFSRAWEAIRDEALAVSRNLAEVPRFHARMAAQAPIFAI